VDKKERSSEELGADRRRKCKWSLSGIDHGLHDGDVMCIVQVHGSQRKGTAREMRRREVIGEKGTAREKRRRKARGERGMAREMRRREVIEERGIAMEMRRREG
jgi:hypothetical protein